MIRWRATTEGTDGIAAAGGSVVVFGVEQAVCLDAQTGATLWVASAPRSNGRIPCRVDGDQVIAEFQDVVVAFDLGTGSWAPTLHAEDLVLAPMTLVANRAVVEVGDDALTITDGAGLTILELEAEGRHFDPSPPVLLDDGGIAFTDAAGVTWCIDLPVPGAPKRKAPRRKGNNLLRAIAEAISVQPSEPLGEAVYAAAPEDDPALREAYADWFCHEALDAAIAASGFAGPDAPTEPGYSERRFRSLVRLEARIGLAPVRVTPPGVTMVFSLLRAAEAPDAYHLDNASHDIRRRPHEPLANEARAFVQRSLCISLGRTVEGAIRHQLFGDWEEDDPRFEVLARKFPRPARRDGDGAELGRELIVAAASGASIRKVRSLARLRRVADKGIGPGSFDRAFDQTGLTPETIDDFHRSLAAMTTMVSTAAVLSNAFVRSEAPGEMLEALREATIAFLRTNTRRASEK